MRCPQSRVRVLRIRRRTELVISMKIAFLSGKGGTGKTTVSANLAWVMGLDYIDCDVEEPNGHIFLKPAIETVEKVTVPVPVIDQALCTLCGACVQACQFNALARTMSNVLFFKDLCHGCGACAIACPARAIGEERRAIGTLSEGRCGQIAFSSGKLNIKEPMAGPVISALKKRMPEGRSAVIDCAPGTSCNVVKALDGADYAVLVTEPTRFGLHDLKLAVDLVRTMGMPFSVLINRSGDKADMIRNYCVKEAIGIVGEIPFSRRAAELYSKGILLSSDDDFSGIFQDIASRLSHLVNLDGSQAGDICKS